MNVALLEPLVEMKKRFLFYGVVKKHGVCKCIIETDNMAKVISFKKESYAGEFGTIKNNMAGIFDLQRDFKDKCMEMTLGDFSKCRCEWVKVIF